MSPACLAVSACERIAPTAVKPTLVNRRRCSTGSAGVRGQNRIDARHDVIRKVAAGSGERRAGGRLQDHTAEADMRAAIARQHIQHARQRIGQRLASGRRVLGIQGRKFLFAVARQKRVQNCFFVREELINRTDRNARLRRDFLVGAGRVVATLGK